MWTFRLTGSKCVLRWCESHVCVLVYWERSACEEGLRWTCNDTFLNLRWVKSLSKFNYSKGHYGPGECESVLPSTMLIFYHTISFSFFFLEFKIQNPKPTLVCFFPETMTINERIGFSLNLNPIWVMSIGFGL